MSLLQCPRCLIPLTIGVCPRCLVDSVVEETQPVTPEVKAAAKKQMQSHVRYLAHKAAQHEASRKRAKEGAAAAGSEMELRNAVDVLSWAQFHLARAGYPASFIQDVARLQAKIEAKQRLDAERFKKGETA